MRIAIVGPTHPYKGGIAQYTTELAHRLHAVGHEVELVSWKAQYPGFLYPGDQFVPHDQPELPVFTPTHRGLSWYSPPSWWRWAKRMRTFDQIIFVWWVPTIQGPVYLTMLKALGKRKPRTSIICHNVLPHEPKPGDKQLARAVFNRVDQLVVHTPAQADLARSLTKTTVNLADLPFALPGTPEKRSSGPYKVKHRLLFFGIVRHYKGLDVLLEAMAQLPGVHLTVAGEFWESEFYEKLIAKLDIGKRVTLHKGYLPAEELAGTFADVDAAVLPYRGGTGSSNVLVAFAYGVPVIATTAGPLKAQVHDGVDGLQCEPDNVDSLVKAIRHFYEPGMAEKLREGVPIIPNDYGWAAYIQALTGS
jgi:glycosyltransferase involved in cell wall biosynthesis